MKGFGIIVTLSLCILPVINALAQRGHEIQVQFGVSLNKGVSFYDYREDNTKRHNFEFDQKYTSDFYAINWRYPINSYLEVGFYTSHSIRASLLLLEAESFLFNSEGTDVRDTSPLFLGMTKLFSKDSEIGIDVRLTVTRFNKFKTYAVVNAGVQRISVAKKPSNVLEVQDEALREDLLKTYLVCENIHKLGFGLGLSRLLNHGINIKIIEIYGRILPKTALMLSSPVSIEIRTGVSYQFYKRR